MGELAGNFQDSPEGQIARDAARAIEPPEGKVKTHVDDCFADAINSRDNLPVFKVGHEEFHQNMNYGRKRIRFTSGSNVQRFMQGSQYKQSFWIQHDKDDMMRKIK